MKTLKQIYARNFLTWELLLSLAAAGLFLWWAESKGGQHGISDALRGNRAVVYSLLASLAGTLLGFVLTAVSIVMAWTQTGRFKLLRLSPHYKTLFKVYYSAVGWFAVLTVAALAALVLDRDSRPLVWTTYVIVWLLVLAGLRLSRCIWVLHKITAIATQSSPSSTEAQQT